jgi:5,10-methylenetetrahydromethanopterin reductase
MIAGGEDWRRMYEAMPERTRHLAMHDGHLVGVNAQDERFVTGEFLAKHGLALDRAAWRDRLAALEAEGATEIAFQPAGPDIPRELEAFASLVG